MTSSSRPSASARRPASGVRRSWERKLTSSWRAWSAARSRRRDSASVSRVRASSASTSSNSGGWDVRGSAAVVSVSAARSVALASATSSVETGVQLLTRPAHPPRHQPGADGGQRQRRQQRDEHHGGVVLGQEHQLHVDADTGRDRDHRGQGRGDQLRPQGSVTLQLQQATPAPPTTRQRPRVNSRTAVQPAHPAVPELSARDAIVAAGLDQPVPAPMDGQQQPRIRRVVLELLAQPAHVHGDRRTVAEVPTPDPTHQHLPAEDLVDVHRQEREQVELADGQRQQPAVAAGLPAGAVDGQRTDGDPTGGRRVARALVGAAQQRVDAEYDLARRERLDHVVVGTGLQTRPAGPAPRRARTGSAPQRCHRCCRRRRSTSSPDRPGSITSSTTTSWAQPPPLLERIGAVGRPVHLQVLAAQVGEQHLGNRRVVLDDQHGARHVASE